MKIAVKFFTRVLQKIPKFIGFKGRRERFEGLFGKGFPHRELDVHKKPRGLLNLCTMWKDRLHQVVVAGRIVFKWSWIPIIIYLG